MRRMVNAAARSHLIPPFQMDQRAEKRGHAALKQQLKLCTVHSNNPFISPACNTSEPPLGGVYVSRCCWEILVFSPPASHSFHHRGPEKGLPGVHAGARLGPPHFLHGSHVQTLSICDNFYQKEGAIQNECPKRLNPDSLLLTRKWRIIGTRTRISSVACV